MNRPNNLWKQFVAHYTNIKGEEIEKIFTRQPADKTLKEIVKFWKDVDQLSIRERRTQRAEYMEGTKKRTLVFQLHSERTEQ